MMAVMQSAIRSTQVDAVNMSLTAGDSAHWTILIN